MRTVISTAMRSAGNLVWIHFDMQRYSILTHYLLVLPALRIKLTRTSWTRIRWHGPDLRSKGSLRKGYHNSKRRLNMAYMYNSRKYRGHLASSQRKNDDIQ